MGEKTGGGGGKSSFLVLPYKELQLPRFRHSDFFPGILPEFLMHVIWHDTHSYLKREHTERDLFELFIKFIL